MPYVFYVARVILTKGPKRGTTYVRMGKLLECGYTTTVAGERESIVNQYRIGSDYVLALFGTDTAVLRLERSFDQGGAPTYFAIYKKGRTRKREIAAAIPLNGHTKGTEITFKLPVQDILNKRPEPLVISGDEYARRGG